MGVKNENQQPAQPLTPQQQSQLAGINRLRAVATTPYSGGNAPNGAAAQGVAQLVAALLARRKQQALQQGRPNGALQVPQPSTGPTPLPQGAPMSGAPGAAPGMQIPAPSTGPSPLPQPQPMVNLPPVNGPLG